MKTKFLSALMIAALLVGLAVFAGGAAADDPPPVSAAAAATADPCTDGFGTWLEPDDSELIDGTIARRGEVDCIQFDNGLFGNLQVFWHPQAGLASPGRSGIPGRFAPV